MSGYPYHLPLCNSWGQVVWGKARSSVSVTSPAIIVVHSFHEMM